KKRAPTIAPTSAQNTIEFTCSSDTPRLGPSRERIHAPNRNPRAIPTPCGEIAKRPSTWTRSRTGHPIAASGLTRPSVAASSREGVGDGAAEQEPTGHVGREVDADVHARGPDAAGER